LSGSAAAGAEAHRARLVTLGRVRGPYGVKGWVRIEPYTERVETLGGFDAWWLGRDGGWQRSPVAEWAVHGAHIVARLEGFQDREAAAALRGAEVAVPREALPGTAGNEFYEVDLIGLEVVNRAGERLGRVERLFGNGAHEVASVRWQGGERLIPFVAPVLERIDLDGGEIHVDWDASW
jgi:16S rRNA processing protein RimM